MVRILIQPGPFNEHITYVGQEVKRARVLLLPFRWTPPSYYCESLQLSHENTSPSICIAGKS